MLENVLSSPFSVVAYSVMIWLLFDTLVLAACTETALSAARRIKKQSEQAHEGSDFAAARGLGHRVVDSLQRSQSNLGLLEKVAPVAGLGFTMAAFILAIPGLNAAMASDPDAVFNKFGVGAGTSLIGAVCLVVAIIEHHRVQATLPWLVQAVNQLRVHHRQVLRRGKEGEDGAAAAKRPKLAPHAGPAPKVLKVPEDRQSQIRGNTAHQEGAAS